MKQNRPYLWPVYLGIFLIFLLGSGAVLHYGKSLEPLNPQIPTHDTSSSAPLKNPAHFLQRNLQTPLSLFLLQIMAIFPMAHLLGRLFKRIGQPAVIGEITAGIILGPSIFGAVWPSAYHLVFPANSLDTLRLMGQIGILIYMFLIGMESNLQVIKEKAQTTLLVSHAGIFIPFVLGMAASLFLYEEYKNADAFNAFALFMGIAMSITAFPVLARILQEKGLAATPLGTTALAAAAFDDVTAWTILALIIAIVESTSFLGTFYSLIFFGACVLIMVFFLRPFLSKKFSDTQEPGKDKLALVLGIIFLVALATQAAGIHALFGAFVAGLLMPQSMKFKKFISERLEYFSAAFLLPLFFAVTGVRTRIGLLNDAHDWLACLFILFIATLGKFGGTAAAARYSGMNWRDSCAIGALMNSRGLMELIVLNLGYEMGIFSDEMFAMLILMALITTFMTGPLLDIFIKKEKFLNWAMR